MSLIGGGHVGRASIRGYFPMCRRGVECKSRNVSERTKSKRIWPLEAILTADQTHCLKAPNLRVLNHVKWVSVFKGLGFYGGLCFEVNIGFTNIITILR